MDGVVYRSSARPQQHSSGLDWAPPHGRVGSFMYTYMYPRIHTCIHAFMHVCGWVEVCMCACVHVCVRACMHVSTHICMYAAYMRTCIRA